MPSAVTSRLKRYIEIKSLPVEVTGSVSPTYIAWIIAQWSQAPQRETRPLVLVTPNDRAAKDLCADLRALGMTRCHLLESFDESPYSGLYPSAALMHDRMRFLWQACFNKGFGVFVGSVDALLQKTLPRESLLKTKFTLETREEVDLNNLCETLSTYGYTSVPIVEDEGTFSRRGDILDIFPPHLEKPARLEFFGDQIESIRGFEIESQRSDQSMDLLELGPCREILLTDENVARAAERIKVLADEHGIKRDVRQQLLAPLEQKILPRGIDYWTAYFYDTPSIALDLFAVKPLLLWIDAHEITASVDRIHRTYKEQFDKLMSGQELVPEPQAIMGTESDLHRRFVADSVFFNRIHIQDLSKQAVEFKETTSEKVFDVSDLATVVRAAREAKKDFFIHASEKILEYKRDGAACFFWASTQTQAQRTHYLLDTHGVEAQIVEPQITDWQELIRAQAQNKKLIHVIPRTISCSFRLPEDALVFIREEDLYGSRTHNESRTQKKPTQGLEALSFSDLSPNDLIVHVTHGVGIYDGLKKMTVQGVDSEFIQLRYRDNDKLYLPVYRINQIQKYSSPTGTALVDKLGTTTWQKAKVKVRNALKDVADELLNLYAKRASATGFSFSAPNNEYREFEASFPYDETPDQEKAINDVLLDMHKPRPMDRLVCGDVGFGKTEVALRAAFKAVQDNKQVAILVPTTVLAFQHYQTFQKRMKDTAINVALINRFVSPSQIKKTLADLKLGKVDLIIGTHRLLSKDVEFKDLGLLIVDEEQKFGVTHKEKIKRFKTQVDVLTLTATPIPRTLNMALMGVRDLSLIQTPPPDRLSIRTFVSRSDPELIRRAIQNEVQRGGQIYFIHNRVQSIAGVADEIRAILPNVRMRIGHGQMADEDLEKTMLAFFNHEFDVLLCTTIIESGLDIPRANTIIIDRADTFGLSQLYQLRGRVGRSKERAYAYLLIPPQGMLDPTAQERLKVIQEYSDIGSGFHIAHHDLELRGSGNILGEDQSGHISAVGYELYMDLLQQALAEAKGEVVEDDLEPEMNLRIPALIPDEYIGDIRLRLHYYKQLGQIKEEGDLDRIEAELVDRFGKVPDPVINLFGVMLIRRICKQLGVRDISSGPKNLSLKFSAHNAIKPEAAIKLATSQPKKYQITPDNTLIIRLSSETWAPIVEELKGLKRLLL